MSWIRWGGVILGALCLFGAILGRSEKRLTRGESILTGVCGICLVGVGLDPSIVDHVLIFKKTGRIVTVLVIGQLFLMACCAFLLVRIKNMDARLGRLVHNMALREFLREFGPVKDFQKKILIIIPAYNEAENLKVLLGRIPKEVLGYKTEVIVAVDGATDETEKVVREFDIPAVVNQVNRGGGAALKAGYELAIRSGAEIVVTMDADGQHQPEEIPILVEPILKGEADFVNGSRILGKQEKGDLSRQVGIFFFNKLLSFLLGKRITDCSNSFRAIKTESLSLLTLKEDQFHTTELLIEALSRGLKYKEVPITIKRRTSGESKKPRTIRYGSGVLMAILKTWLRT